uniref:Reverse transcriptase domain-containing protein n=1 Tax=Dicentrarchus labrax TaxID=13489 RepID=A0A8P4KRJ8_DICLA
MKLFYKGLYSSECTSSSKTRAAFLNKIKLPSLSDVQKADLCKPISKEEVLQAIRTLKGGKAPGPDGFGPEFYKTFSQEIVGPLTDMYLDSFTRGCLPPTLGIANISVILKRDKPSDMCGSYRPISLISVDSKLLSKLLARRLETLLPTLINPDQTGFVHGRYSTSNVRKLLNIIQFTSQYKQKALAVSLDAEKAFDRVEWGYLFDVLGRFGLGGDFLKWIQTIYHSPTAVVITNGRRSEPFPIARGVRQGCPLSPLLFALALEPLAETIRLHNDIKGITIGHKEHKIALYADDILVFLSSPQLSISAIMNIFNKFSNISGYKINFCKSEAMPLGALSTTEAPENFPFRWSRSGFTYLGIKVSPDLRDLQKLNLAPICTSVKRDLERWQNLPLSLFGRISLIKMNVLPRLLYPLQMLPLYLSRKINLDLEKAFSKFIWQGKKPRQRLKILQSPTDMGGLSMPNILYYNWACHARHFWLWLHSYAKRETCIDSWACHPYSPWSLITCEAKKINPEVKGNLIIYNSIRIWHDISKHLGKKTVKSLLSPITQNPDFPAGVSSPTFLSWRDKGIHVIGDLLRDNTLLSFQQLQETFSIPKHHFFGYLQIRHFMSLQTTSFSTNISYSDAERFLLERKNRKHFIASFYSLLGSSVSYHIPDISHKWEKDLNNEYIEDDWHATIRLIRSTSTCNRLRETQYKILHRLHITPVILNKIDHSISPLCNKCNLERGTYFHYFWECKLISRFWTLISKVVSGIFKVKIEKDPGVFLLGLPSRDLHLTASHCKLFEKLLLVARKCILKNWIKVFPPSVTLWYREVFNILPHERLQAVVKGKDELFLKIWTPFLDYIPADLKNLILRGRQFSDWNKTSPRLPQIEGHR